MKVVILVTHLLGTGHLIRSMTLAAAFEKAGHATCVISGGTPVAHLKTQGVGFVQLPPVRSDGTDFSRLLDADGAPVTAAYLAARQDTLLQAVRRSAADALITELFPFGRRILKDEFVAVLKAAQGMAQPPAVFASVRDILAPPSKPRKAEFAADTLARYYDAVLVHSDPDIMRLDLSWPVDARVARLLRYTGFVAAPAPASHPDAAGAGEILVSAGGGDVGGALFDAARAAALLDPARRWRLLVGGQNAQTLSQRLNDGAPPNLRAEPARPDFRQMLHHAAASVSLCGYNTALDVLQTGCPAVFVPFDEGNEVEQTIRAKALARQDGIGVLAAAGLSPEALLAALDTVIAAPHRPRQTARMAGAARSVEIVAEHCGGPHAG